MSDVASGFSSHRRVIHGWSLRWSEARAAEARANGFWPDETSAEVALRALNEAPDRIVIIDETRQLTVRELVMRAQGLARTFVAQGLQPGDVISLMLPNWHEATIIYLAATFAGLVANLILPNHRNNEVVFTLDDCRSKMIFVPERFRKFDYVEMMHDVNQKLQRPVKVIVLRGDARGNSEFAALMAEHHDAELPKVDPDSIKMVMYTSGTSGRAKGVLHSHNSIAAAVTQIHRYWYVEPGDCFFVPSPISHIGGSLYAFELPLMAKTQVVLQESWEPDAAVKAFETYGCTHMAGATPFLQGLLASAQKAGTRLPKLKVFICGGASVPPSLVRDATAQFESCIVSRVFGCTEVPMITVGSMAPGDVEHAAETDGKPGLCYVKVKEDTEILAVGPQMLLGYLRREDEEGKFDDNGWFLTGDCATLVDGEYLVITGRFKDIIIRNGENIAPKEIEDILILHPEIAEISIIGLPDARRGEMACAVIVPTPGRTPNVDDLRDFLNIRNVARFKMPERVVLRESLPHNAAGKVLKNILRDMVLDLSLTATER